MLEPGIREADSLRWSMINCLVKRANILHYRNKGRGGRYHINGIWAMSDKLGKWRGCSKQGKERNQADRQKAREIFDRHAEFLSGRVEVRPRRQDEVPFWGLSYRLSVVRPGNAIEGAETGSQVCDKWRVNESHKFLDKYLTYRVTRGQGSVVCLSCCELPGGFLGVGWTAVREGPHVFPLAVICLL